MPHPSVILVRIVLAAAGVTAATALASCGGSPEAPRDAAPAPTVSARVAVAERVASARRVELSGTVIARQSAAVSSRVMALVTAIHAEVGDEVRAGQALISIDPTAAEGQAAQARGGLAQAEAALTLARRNLERFEALASTQSASQLEVDAARMQFEQARGAVEQARGAVSAAQSIARESRVVAPFAGRVSARLVEVGDMASPGRPLASIDSTTGRRLLVAVPESVALTSGLRPGDAVTVTLDAQPQSERTEIAGRLVEVSPGPDPRSHSYTWKIDLPAQDGAEIPTGAAGRAWVPASSGAREAVRVPIAALIESGGLTLVVVRDEGGFARSRVVTVGSATEDGWIEVLSGLAGGETLALGLAVAPPSGSLVEVLP